MKRHHSTPTVLLPPEPQVKVNLGTKNWTLTPIVLGANVVQFTLAYCLRDSPWWAVAIVAYTIGGIINHGLTLAMHELSHNMASKNMTYNRVLGLLSNIPLGIPSFACVAPAVPTCVALWLTSHPGPASQHLQALPPGAPQVPRRGRY